MSAWCAPTDFTLDVLYRTRFFHQNDCFRGDKCHMVHAAKDSVRVLPVLHTLLSCLQSWV